MENDLYAWRLVKAGEAVEAERQQLFGPDVAAIEEFHPRWDPVEKRIQPYSAVEQPSIPLSSDS